MRETRLNKICMLKIIEIYYWQNIQVRQIKELTKRRIVDKYKKINMLIAPTFNYRNCNLKKHVNEIKGKCMKIIKENIYTNTDNKSS